MILQRELSEQALDQKIGHKILDAQTPEEIARCFSIFQELRPSLTDQNAFVEQILRQNLQGYFLSYLLENHEVGACIGFRLFETLAWGKILYIDDLITRETSRKRGYAKVLLTYTKEVGLLKGCAEIHLDTGYHRHDAHRLYLNLGFQLNCHHLSAPL